MTDERAQCEFSLIRYVPDPVKNEFINIGVLLREKTVPGRTEFRFTRDWSRVRCIDPHADIAMLEAVEAEVRGAVDSSWDIIRLLQDSLSNTVQITEPKACLAETFLTQVEQLMRMYVEAQRADSKQRPSGRLAILGDMRKRFEAEGAWARMLKRIPVDRYTRKGDPLRIDCGYRPNGVIKMFHAVALRTDVEEAKSLAFSLPLLTEGIQRIEGTKLEFTAIVEPIRDVAEEQEQIDRYRFGIEAMELSQIRVLTTNDLTRIAVRAREELRI